MGARCWSAGDVHQPQAPRTSVHIRHISFPYITRTHGGAPSPAPQALALYCDRWASHGGSSLQRLPTLSVREDDEGGRHSVGFVGELHVRGNHRGWLGWRYLLATDDTRYYGGGSFVGRRSRSVGRKVQSTGESERQSDVLSF
ncbi:hypothetical protein CONPUDRAFT_170292 [Coniophora puteana RWD-64-598 SS2]|uniref:Uncharacterized protein n=1 Tax=Coniophora puteana (strain RWD-64-598) TaxID=741705 RepID=R7SEY7_CONPW|nr:uncharacterized protein CONPUDRAFT_170292 [Coniophora puteana RWD-64-598 SS2]EIW74302.1 hypothetical protein CONPUDRAFT_170292 [Coniophora puteana RWD-64-598 SS2]